MISYKTNFQKNQAFEERIQRKNENFAQNYKGFFTPKCKKQEFLPTCIYMAGGAGGDYEAAIAKPQHWMG